MAGRSRTGRKSPPPRLPSPAPPPAKRKSSKHASNSGAGAVSEESSDESVQPKKHMKKKRTSAAASAASEPVSHTGTNARVRVPSTYQDPFSSNAAHPTHPRSAGQRSARSVASAPAATGARPNPPTGVPVALSDTLKGASALLSLKQRYQRSHSEEDDGSRSPSPSLNASPAASRPDSSSRHQGTSARQDDHETAPRPRQAGGSKAIADGLKELREELKELKAKEDARDQRVTTITEAWKRTRGEIKNLAVAMKNYEEWMQNESDTNSDFNHRIGVVEKQAKKTRATVDQIFALLGDREGGGGGDQQQPADVDDDEVNQRELMVGGLCRGSLRRFMGVTTIKGRPPAALGNGRYWTTDIADAEDRFLRPDFEQLEPNLLSWFPEVVNAIITQGDTLVPMSMPKEEKEAFFGSLTVLEVEEGLKKYWKTLHTRLMNSQKPKKVQKATSVANRRHGRKVTKAKWRSSVRKLIAELSDSIWDYLFEARYQSTDVSQDEDSAGEDDEDEDESSDDDTKLVKPKRHVSVKDWLRMRPDYRAQKINDLLDRLDAHVSEARKGAHGVNEKYVTYDKKLPKAAKHPPNLVIPRAHVDPVWLLAHNGQDSTKFMRFDLELDEESATDTPGPGNTSVPDRDQRRAGTLDNDEDSSDTGEDDEYVLDPSVPPERQGSLDADLEPVPHPLENVAYFDPQFA